MSARTTVIWRLDWAWRLCFQGSLHTLGKLVLDVGRGLSSWPCGLLHRVAEVSLLCGWLPEWSIQERVEWVPQCPCCCSQVISHTVISMIFYWLHKSAPFKVEWTKQVWIPEGWRLREAGYYTPLVWQTLSSIEPLPCRLRVKVHSCNFSNLANILVLNLVTVS